MDLEIILEGTLHWSFPLILKTSHAERPHDRRYFNSMTRLCTVHHFICPLFSCLDCSLLELLDLPYHFMTELQSQQDLLRQILDQQKSFELKT